MSDYAKPDSEKFRAFYVQKRRKKRKSIVEQLMINYNWSTFTSSNQRYLANSGTLSANALLESGQGKYFNGIDSRIEDVNCVVGDIGVAIVIFKSTDTGYIFSQEGQGDNRLYIKADGRIGLGSSANIITGATPSDGQFHTIVLVWNNGNWTYTVDGVDTYSGTYLGTVDIAIGSLSGSKWYSDYNESIIKDVYVFNRLLTEIELSKQPEQFFNDALLDSTCVLNMPMNDKESTCRDYVANTDYPIQNFLTTTNTNAQNLSYGLQDAKLITDGLGLISGVSNFFECNGISKATIPTNARTTNIELVVNPSELSGNILDGSVVLNTTGLTLNQDNTIILSNQTINGEITLGNGFKGTIKLYKETEA